MKFEELKLTYGYPLQLQTTNSLGQPERHACRLIGCLPGRGILVSVPKSAGRLVKFRSGQKLVFRFMIDNGIGVFISVVELQTVDPYPLLHITYPETVNFKGIRNATRVAVDMVAEVYRSSAPELPPVAAHISDISITGLRLDIGESIGELGDLVEIRTDLVISRIQRELKLNGVIRSRIDPSDGAEVLSYGIELSEMDEEQFLLLYAYVSGQIAFQEVIQSL